MVEDSIVYGVSLVQLFPATHWHMCHFPLMNDVDGWGEKQHFVQKRLPGRLRCVLMNVRHARSIYVNSGVRLCTSGCQSGAVVRSMFEINISACHLWGRGFHSSCDREGDSLRQRRFPPGAPVSSYIHNKSPNIVYRANNDLVDAQLSIQYF
jgi:hypothetical protein